MKRVQSGLSAGMLAMLTTVVVFPPAVWAQDREIVDQSSFNALTQQSDFARSDRRFELAQADYDLSDQVDRLLEQARNAISVGNKDQANKLLGQALMIANRISETFVKSWQLMNIAKAYAEVGNLEQALTVVNRISDPDSQSEPLRDIVSAYLEAKNIDQALVIADRIPDSSWKSMALRDVAIAYLEARNINSALVVVNRIPNPYSQSLALRDIAEVYQEAGNNDQALAMANRISEFKLKSEILLNIAETYRGAGNNDQALAVINKIGNTKISFQDLDDINSGMFSTSRVSLFGAGSTFTARLYQLWFLTLNLAVPNLSVDYQSVGSGAGVEQFIYRTVDFGASDVAMDDQEIAEINNEVIMLPMTANSVVLAYNLPGVKDLKISQAVMADIFLGKITEWNDPKILSDNPRTNLPNQPIVVVHRSDGDITTGIFTKNLSAMSPAFNREIGQGKAVEWPTTRGRFIGGQGNEGVTAAIQNFEGAIGYLDYGYANSKGVAMAKIQNKNGNFVAPSDENASAALANFELPKNLRAFVVNPGGADSYPIVAYTWMLVYRKYDDPEKAKAMEVIIEYGLNQGQDVVSALGYVPLPKTIRQKVAEAADVLYSDYTITIK